MGILPIPYVNYENPAWLVSLAATKITGAFGAATFNGNVSSSTEFRLAGNSFSRVADIDSSGGWGGGYNFNLNSDTAQRDSTGSVSAIRFNGTQVELFAESSGSPGAISPRYTFSPTEATFNGALTVTGLFNIGSADCRTFRDSGNFYLESDGVMFLRRTATAAVNWALGADGRTFAKVGVWHMSYDDNLGRFYYNSSSATHFNGNMDFVSHDRNHGLKADGTIVWGSNQSGGNNARGTLSWDTDKAVISVPLNMDLISGGLTKYVAVSHEFNSTVKLGDFTVATLPSASAYAGHECNVTDSSVTTFGSTVAGGGSSRVKLYSNGTNWTVQAA